jgi:hypothetical protein
MGYLLAFNMAYNSGGILEAAQTNLVVPAAEKVLPIVMDGNVTYPVAVSGQRKHQNACEMYRKLGPGTLRNS